MQQFHNRYQGFLFLMFIDRINLGRTEKVTSKVILKKLKSHS